MNTTPQEEKARDILGSLNAYVDWATNGEEDALKLIKQEMQSEYDRGRQEERKRIVEIVKGIEEHLCRFNEGKQKCECFHETKNFILKRIEL